MSKKTRNEVTIGITVLVVLAMAFYITVVLAGWPENMAPKQEIRIKIPYQIGLRGLVAGSPIYLGGVKIGRIDDTDIKNLAEAGTDKNRVYVFFTMKLPKQYHLRDDCVLVPQSNVLGGETLLTIKDLGSKGHIIKDHQTVELKFGESLTDALAREFDPKNPGSMLSQIKSQLDTTNKTSFMASLLKTARNLRQITEKINQEVALDPQRKTLLAKLHTILNHISIFTERLDVQLDSTNKQAVLTRLQVALDKLDSDLVKIGDLIDTNRPNITEMVASLQHAAKEVETNLPVITKDIKTALQKANIALDDMQKTLDNLKAFSSQAKELIMVNRDDIDLLVRNAAEISSNLKFASQDIRRAPWKLLYKPKKDELKIQGLIDAAGAFASGAERLDRATIRLRRILSQSGDTLTLEKKKLQDIITELETSFTQQKKAEEQFLREIPD